jgi:hypothetical protein
MAHPLTEIPCPYTAGFRSPTIDELADTVVLPPLQWCACGQRTDNINRVCDGCIRLDQDDFGRDSAVFEEKLTKDTRPAFDCGVAMEASERAMNSDRPVGEVRGCTCGVCRTDWSE